MKIVRISSHPLCQQFLCPLSEASEDETNGERMVASNRNVVRLDHIARYHAEKSGYQRFSSSDALLFGPALAHHLADKDGNAFAVVEFKNGRLESDSRKPNRDALKVKIKAYCSVLLLIDALDMPLSDIRDSFDFVLVFNKSKQPSHQDEVVSAAVSSSESLDTMASGLHAKGKSNFIRFGLNSLKGFCYRNIYTYSTEEFEADFLPLIGMEKPGRESSADANHKAIQ